MMAPRLRTANGAANGAHKRTKFAAVLSSKQQLEEVREALKSVDSLELDLHVGRLGALQGALVNGHTPDVLLVDFGSDKEGTFTDLAELLREHPSEIQVLATSDTASVDLIRRLMRLGIADFVPRPLNRADLLAGVEAALSKRPSAEDRRGKRGKIVAFTRSCGGIGATTLAVQMAAELADRARKKSSSVCVVDFDLQFGSVASSLDMKPGLGLLQVLETPSRMDRDFLASVTSHHRSGIDVVAAPGKIVPLDSMTIDIATDIVALAAQAYDHVILDLPRGWTNWTLGLLKSADLLVLVTEINVTALQRCLGFFELLAQQDLQAVPLHVLVNRFTGRWTSGPRRVRQAEKALSRKLDFLVRRDVRTAMEARDRGVLLAEVRRSSPIVRDMRRFVDRVSRDFTQHEAALVTGAGRPGILIEESGDVLKAV